ncbi:hypothetical protein [Streptomyces sp. NBC_00316]|nr:hypothetical protein [Streptomyces sp. NBC_00316]
MQRLTQHVFSLGPQTVRTARTLAMQVLDSWGGCRRCRHEAHASRRSRKP